MEKASKVQALGGNSSYQNFVNMISVYSHDRGWVVRHKVMENQQQSEIFVVEELIQELTGFHVVITADPLHCQKKTLALIIDGGNDYIVAIKKNQSNLFKASQKVVESERASDSFQTSENLHGRSTTRSTTIYAISTELLPLWAGAKYIIAIERTGNRWQGKKSLRRLVKFHEQHYYLSSLDWSASKFAEAIQGHRVRASQSVLTKGFEKKHHVFIIHCSPFPFLSPAKLESGFLVDRIKGNASYQSEVLRTV